ncbi:MAG TPA: PA14 domain-containing protein [Albitalea sp.]|uniref:PA14 domain-containing protein n=1 Tax=Piscinibacter sp. TaxID=1903157 RepID=UPI002ECFC4DB
MTTRRAFLAIAAGAGATLLLQRDVGGLRRASSNHLAEAELEHAAQRAALCSSANVAGVGLRGEYFADEGCRGPALLIRQDATIDFDASLDWPAERRDQRPRSVRWTGWVKPPLPGRYRFHPGTSEAQVQVSRQRVAGPDADDGIELAAGRFYPIAIELDRIAPGAADVRLEWTAPHGARFLVPRALLYLPTA